MAANAPVTDEQHSLRAAYAAALETEVLATAQSVDERARRPDPVDVPADVTVHVEIAPPSQQPHPLLEQTGVLKSPERVPLFFYTPRSDGTEPTSASNPTRVIFFIHGGGYLVGHPAQPPYIQLFAHLLRAITLPSGDAGKCVLVAPSYRLATVPENAFPAGIQDLVAAYDHVLGKGYDPSNIFIAGDSAGGNLAIVLSHLVLQSNRPPPRGVISIAPYAILTPDLMPEYARALADKDILNVHMYKYSESKYIGEGVSPIDPLVSGAFIPFSASWPKTLILVGNADMLIDSARELEKRLAALNRPVQLVEYDQRPHGWWVMPHIFPENIYDAGKRIAQFVLH